MATANFLTQDNFPLFASDFFDACECVDEDTGETFWDDERGRELFDECAREIDELNAGLTYYRIELRGGYYSGVQVYLTALHDGLTADDFTADEWNAYRRAKRRDPGMFYDWEFALPIAEQKRAEQRERERIAAYFRGKRMRDGYGFREYIAAHFSNGEAVYRLAA